MTTINDYVASIKFRFFQPQTKLPGMAEVGKVALWFGMPLDSLNTVLPPDSLEASQRFREVSKTPKMSTIAIGAIIDQLVRQMRPNEAYVNVGVWNGFTLLAGMVNNLDKICIGIDNFAKFGGPREDLLTRFQRWKSPRHQFFDMDYVEYLKKIHQGPIGVYMYDGPHDYDNQLRGLELAETFFSNNCVIVVDDIDKPAPWQATMDFIAARKGRYRVVLDKKTARNCHPTFWQGLCIVQKMG